MSNMSKNAVRIYNSGYMAGHQDTVEGCFTDIFSADMSSYHEDVVSELMKKECRSPYCECEKGKCTHGLADKRGVPINMSKAENAYDKIDIFLRNNLDDEDYQEYSRYLDTVLESQSTIVPKDTWEKLHISDGTRLERR